MLDDINFNYNIFNLFFSGIMKKKTLSRYKVEKTLPCAFPICIRTVHYNNIDKLFPYFHK